MLYFLRRDIFLAGGLVTGVVAAGRLAVSRSQQGAAVSLLLARQGTGNARWRRVAGFVVTKYQVGRGTGSASPSGRISDVGQSFVVGGVLIKTAVLGPTCWPYLYQTLHLFLEDWFLPLMRKCAATRLPPTVAMQFSPLACGRKS